MTSRKYWNEGAGPEQDMLFLRDGVGSGCEGKFFRQRRHHHCLHPPKIMICVENGFFNIGPQSLGATLSGF